jgi:hypothetical protein
MKLGPLQKEFIRCLRSGEFKQARNRLYELDGDVYANCCLGVACQVAEANGVELPKTVLKMCYLPKSVIEALGFRSKEGFSSLDVSLIAMNDKAMSSFEEIAKRIEGDPEEFFVKSV